MSTIKQYINNFKIRTKSSERARNTSSISPNTRPSSKANYKQSNQQNLHHNDLKHYNIIVNKNNHIQKGQIQIEGDLNFQNKNNKPSNVNQGKNVGHNAFELMSHNQNFKRMGNFTSNAKRKINNRIPRKSPVPVPKNYQHLNIFPFQKFRNLNVTHNNSGHTYAKSVNVNNKNKLFGKNNNPMNKTYNSFRQKNLNNRSLSPITRTNNSGPKLSPNSIKPKYISKSPIPGTENKFKNIHIGSNSNSNNNNKNKNIKHIIKKTVNSNANNKRINNVNIHQNKQMIISGDLTPDSTNNSKMNISSKSANVSINNNQDIIKNKKQNSINNKSTENIHHEKNLIEDNKIDKDSLLISQQLQKSKNQVSERNEREKYNQQNKEKEKEKFSQRSLSQPQSEILKQIELPKPKKIIKKIKNIYTFTHVGFDGEQDKENNQDSYFVFSNFAGHKDYYYLSVCDGHGVEGHFVSSFIKQILPVDLSQNLQDKNILKDTELVHEIITGTFLLANEKLIENENINSTFSGSTCVSVIYTPERLICPNIGDSRAVIGRYNKENKKYIPIELTRDHKPTEEDEAKRIFENDGRIQPFIDEGEFIGPQRVWVKEDDVPGLAMTRSFGDRVAATVGVISEPEIKEWDYDKDDKFMLVASDGVWEFISNDECMNIIGQFYERDDMKGCCEFLYEESKKRWLMEEEVIDDITMILVFFE